MVVGPSPARAVLDRIPPAMKGGRRFKGSVLPDSLLSHQPTPTRQVVSGLARGRVRGDGSGQGLAVPHAPERCHQRQGRPIGTAAFSGTRTPPCSTRHRGDSPRFQPRARPLATPPPIPWLACGHVRAFTFIRIELVPGLPESHGTANAGDRWQRGAAPALCPRQSAQRLRPVR